MFLQQLTEPKNVQFRELYQLENSRQVRAATRLPLAYLGGVKSLANAHSVLAEGFDALALGRVLIHQADLVNAFAAGTVTQSGCTSCNRCVAMMYTPGGTSCVLGEPGRCGAQRHTGGRVSEELATLLAERAIAPALAQFARAMDERDWAALDELLARMRPPTSAPGRCSGRVAIVALMRSYLDDCGPTQHLLGNLAVEVDGAEARSRCYVADLHLGPATRRPDFPTLGEYQDRWHNARDAGGW